MDGLEIDMASRFSFHSDQEGGRLSQHVKLGGLGKLEALVRFVGRDRLAPLDQRVLLRGLPIAEKGSLSSELPNNAMEATCEGPRA